MGIFSQKTLMPQTFDSRTPERKQYDQFLANFVSNYGSQYQPGKAYGGNFTAPASRFERRGLDEFLTNYLDQPLVTPNLSRSQKYYQDTLSGGFDPGSSEYYGALRGELDYNKRRAIDDLNAELGSRGKFFSSEALDKTGDITAQTSIAKDKILQELAREERGYKERAASNAPGLEKFISGIPLERASAATTIGSLPRMLEQADLESLYKDFTRRQGELGDVIGKGSGITSNMEAFYPKQQKSTFESFIAPLLMQAIPALMTGGMSLPFTAGAAGASGAGAAAGGSIPGLAGALGNQGGFWANL